jgi:FkbM family methyltransferase
MEVFFRSKVDVDILARELLHADNLYLRHGITIAEGDCIFDVGANIGFFILFLNKLIKAGTVYGFEPIPDVFEVLKLNTDRHNQLTLQLFNCGLSEQAGQAEFTYFPRTSVASTMYPDESPEYRSNSRQFVMEEMRLLHPVLRSLIDATPGWMWWPLTEALRRHYQSSRQVACQLRKISDVIREERIAVIDLLKVDTEGAEEHVLAGIDAEHWPMIRQAVVEVHHGLESLQRMEQLLQSHGFHTVSEPVVPGVEHLHVVYARREHL